MRKFGAKIRPRAVISTKIKTEKTIYIPTIALIILVYCNSLVGQGRGLCPSFEGNWVNFTLDNKMPYTLPSGILVYRFGERGSGYKSKTGKVLDYHKIKADALKQKGSLFEDPNFPAEDNSIFFSEPLEKPVEWKRPHEIVQDPKFFLGGASRFDVRQGELGNCWFLAAVANLTLNKELFHLVVPEDNGEFDPPSYNGTFHFRFWKFGRWVDMVIDDRLPTRNGHLVYMHSVDKAEFWSALLEKAYAKQHGSYEALVGGNVSEALEDFTGGVTEMCNISQAVTVPNSSLFQIMSKAFDRSSFMGCSLDGDEDEVEAEGPLGLIRGHAYSITDVKTVTIKTVTSVTKSKTKKSGKEATNEETSVQLLRIRNPWGNSAEWKGAWSDGSSEWNSLHESHKNDFGHSFDADGEFWMCYEDFTKYFNSLDICNLGPEVLDELEEAKKVAIDNQKQIESNGTHNGIQRKKKKWVVNVFEGSWIKGVTAGGCRNYKETFGLNPQYIVQLTDADEEDDDDKCTLIVALMQKFRRKLGKDFLPIGFLIYNLDDPDNTPRPLNETFFKTHRSVDSPLKYTAMREISCRFKLPPGTYCIVPSTFHPAEDGDFILRVFTETKNDMKENDDDIDVENDPDKTEDMINQLKDLQDASNVDNAKKDKEDAAEAHAFFKKVAGEDLEVNWEELKALLDSTFKTEFGFQGFSKDICRSMIAMMDSDRSGKLGFDEFQLLWKSIEHWKNVFRKFDVDKSGTLSSFELRQALNSAGFSVNNRVLQALVLRYGNKEGCLLFDDFIMCAIKLKCMIEVFKERVPDGQKSAVFTIDDWVDKTLYS